MRRIANAIVSGFALAALSLAACSTSHPSQPPGGFQALPPADHDGTGQVGFQYTLPGGDHISTVHYHLTNGTNTYDATADVGTSSTISFVIGGVVAGTGYTLALDAKSDDAGVACSGSSGTGTSDAGQNNGSPFAVVARQSTMVNVQMQCVDTANGQQGSVLVGGVPSCCPTWDTIVANPSSGPANPVPQGTTVTLNGNASGPCDGGPGAGVNLRCVWSIKTGHGTVGPTTTDNAGNFYSTFTCPGPGTNEIDTAQMDCTDGLLPDGGFCPGSLTHGELQFFCGPPPPCTQTGESGVVASPDTSTGACPNDSRNGEPMVNIGMADSSGDYCCIDACNGGPTATPFGPTGACPAPLVNDGTGCCVGLEPCTRAGQANCVQCQLNDTAPNANKTCTATQAQIVAFDIKQGKATAPGPDPAGSCYTCLAQASCLDDTHLGDTNQECDDTVITVGTAAQCHAVIDCVFGTEVTGTGDCSKNAQSVCYCGTAGLTTTCQGNPSAANGACDAQIAAGLGFSTQDGTDVLAHFTDNFRAGGAADQIFSCAHTAGCTACFGP